MGARLDRRCIEMLLNCDSRDWGNGALHIIRSIDSYSSLKLVAVWVNLSARASPQRHTKLKYMSPPHRIAILVFPIESRMTFRSITTLNKR